MSQLVSIILPTYNRAQLIGETLDSVLTQTYTNWECIVVDDGSTDHSEEVISQFLDKDTRFTCVKRPSQHKPGGCGARNYGLSLAKGDYVVFLDSDDLLAEYALFNRLDQLQHTDMDMLVTTSAAFKNTIGDDNRLWNVFAEKESLETLAIRFLKSDMPWNTNGVMWKKDLIEAIGGWNENLSAWQDWELHLRAIASNPKLMVSNQAPDNYFRINYAASIGSTFKQKKYFNSVVSAIFSVQRAFSTQPKLRKTLRSLFRVFVLRSVVHIGFKRQFGWKIFKLLFRKRFFYGIDRREYLGFSLLELFCRSTKLKTFLFKKKHQNFMNLIKIDSTHLKYKVTDLF